MFNENPNLAWIGIGIVASWQTIPEDVYEVSAIDGANKGAQFWKMTFPLIAPLFTINMLLAMRGLLNVFDQIISLPGGGPAGST